MDGVKLTNVLLVCQILEYFSQLAIGLGSVRAAHARTHTVRVGAAGMVGSRTECTLVLQSPVWLGDSQSLSRFAALHSSVSAH